MSNPTPDTSISGIITAIKGDLRAAMNGIASRAIRESGMGYKLTYGVELPRLREIAACYTADRHLAQALWQENIREYKMLAIILYPHDEFNSDIATLWIEDLIPEQAEIAQLMCLDLISTQPYSAEYAFRWMADECQMFQLCGFLVITRLLMHGAQLSPTSESEFIDQADAARFTTYLPLRKTVYNALSRYSETSETAAKRVNDLLT